MRQTARRISLIALALALATPQLAAGESRKSKKEASDEVDYVELAALLVRDGHYDRAELTLRQVDVKQPELDLVRFHTLSGLVYLKKQLYVQAKASFKAALNAGQTDPVIHLQLAQTEFALKEYAAAIKSLDQAGPAANTAPALMMRAEAHFLLTQPGQGFAVLARAAKLFPQERSLLRMRLFKLVEQGLYQEALTLGQDYLEGAASPEDYLALGEALRKGGQLRQAAVLTEQARLRFPDSQDVTLLLAHIHLDQQHPLSAALLLEDAARDKPDLAVEAAELYRRASRHTRALLLNARVADQQKKLKQRLSILLEMGQYEKVAAMAPMLERVALLDDENVRYALAYGYFKIANFDASERHLRRLASPEMFERANQLRRAIETCRERGWECI